MKPLARPDPPFASTVPCSPSRPGAAPAVPSPAAAGQQRQQEESEYGRLRHDLGLFFRRLEKEYEEGI